MELNNIRLLVNDFDKCFTFYSEALGLKATWGEPGADYASFDIGLPSGLSLFKSDLMAQAVGNANKELPKNSREKFVIVIKVDDVDKTYNDIKSKGIEFIDPPTDRTGWGMRAAHLYDPENNLLEIWSELPKEKWDKDMLEDADKYGYE